jgi:hypothetical protein
MKLFNQDKAKYKIIWNAIIQKKTDQIMVEDVYE